jgi:hypothetical protein
LRCIKAVQDNSNFNFFENNMLKNNEKRNIDINVIYVLKIEHFLLSRQLQNVASNSENGNIKGLFCMIPKEGLFAFCSYGIHASPIINNINYDNNNNNNFNIIPGLFQQPWYQTKDENNNEELNIAEKQASNGHNSLCNLRFSRYSTPYSSQSSLVNGYNNKGDTFLALCRVLVSKLKTLQGDITHDDIAKCKSSGYDAIYSCLTEEYVLLNKDYVLPEFIMQVKFDNIIPNSGIISDKGRINQPWLPKAFIPLNLQKSSANISRFNTNYSDSESSPRHEDTLCKFKLKLLLLNLYYLLLFIYFIIASRSTSKLQSWGVVTNILAQNESHYYSKNNNINNNNNNNNQCSGGVKKQNIVMSMQKAFNDFKNNKVNLIKNKANIHKKLYNNIKINLKD